MLSFVNSPFYSFFSLIFHFTDCYHIFHLKLLICVVIVSAGKSDDHNSNYDWAFLPVEE